MVEQKLPDTTYVYHNPKLTSKLFLAENKI